MMDIDLNKTYALAVSGGIDSMVMLHMFANFTPRPDFFVVTVNHNLRAEASADCKFVADYCKRFNVECKTFNVDVPNYCKAMKVSEETGARLLRLGVLNSLDVDYVCTAHNACDNAETVLMHIVRGSGANGSEGIRRVSGKFLRPILDMSREDVERYAREHDVPHVYDVTNSDVKYTRNFLRHKVIPLLTQINANAQQNITRFAENIAEDNAYLDGLADIAAVKFVGHSAEIPSYLLLQPKPIAYRVLRKVFCGLNIVVDLEKQHYDAVINLADNYGGKKVSLPYGMVAVNDYDKVTVAKDVAVLEHFFEIPFQAGVTDTPVGKVLVATTPERGSLKIDLNKIPANAVFRTCREGDTFQKFGGGGTKPLNRYLIDKKIPQRLRKQLLLIAAGHEVLVIVGVEIADSVKVEATSDVRYVSILKNA